MIYFVQFNFKFKVYTLYILILEQNYRFYVINFEIK